MLHLAVVALLGTLMLAQQPPEQVRSTDLPGSVSAPAKTPAAPAPAANASDNEEPVQADSAADSNAPAQQKAVEPPATPPPAVAVPPAPAPPAAPPAPAAAGGKRVAAFWMILPKGP